MRSDLIQACNHYEQTKRRRRFVNLCVSGLLMITIYVGIWAYVSLVMIVLGGVVR
jgi:hypothetical protein